MFTKHWISEKIVQSSPPDVSCSTSDQVSPNEILVVASSTLNGDDDVIDPQDCQALENLLEANSFLDGDVDTNGVEVSQQLTESSERPDKISDYSSGSLPDHFSKRPKTGSTKVDFDDYGCAIVLRVDDAGGPIFGVISVILHKDKGAIFLDIVNV
ncbi:uncharacterized protein LOC107041852 [Diachasma alloeum]|uniref:uncharacterized protein LOC107041852 n=1 Tax=Diachasma alloeum TaxID=454923 RepID=UPI00073843C6|nr:uncharacterized protein LOC107041852 [Diachasma alloeum]